MKKKMQYRVWLSGWALMALLAGGCTDQDVWKGADPTRQEVLAARKERMRTRANESDSYFDEGTQYRIWATSAESTDTPIEGTELGMKGIEARRGTMNEPYIDLNRYNGMITGERDFYGLTTGTTELPAENAVDGTYHIAPSSTQRANSYYPDYQRGQLKYSEREGAVSGTFQIPFKHIMSQVEFQVAKQEGIKSKIELVKIEILGFKTDKQPSSPNEVVPGFSGIVTEADYCVLTNKFTKYNRGTREVIPPAPVEVPVITGTEQPQTRGVVISPKMLFFPSPQQHKDDNECIYLRVTYNDPENYFKRGKENATVLLPIHDNTTNDKIPLYLEQNTSYKLTILFMDDQSRIVILVPQVYEWIDGETSFDSDGDNQGDAEWSDFGQPATFNGVMWSDRNLGAQGGNPHRSAADYYQSLGYYYQYVRNIPYFPYQLRDDWATTGKVVKVESDVKKLLQREGYPWLYPVVDLSSWPKWQEYKKNVGIEADILGSENSIWKLGKWNGDPGTRQQLGISKSESGIMNAENQHRWKDPEQDPAPPGWRIPSMEDFKSIIPSTVYAGNITFRNFVGIVAFQWKTDKDDPVDPAHDELAHMEDVFSANGLKNMKILKNPILNPIFPYPEDPANPKEYEQTGQVYTGDFTNLKRIQRNEINDPMEGRKSVYVLSLTPEDRNSIFMKWQQYWGVIYGIKNVGTDEAYRMRWRVKYHTGEDAISWNADQYPKCLLIIDRYECDADDRLTYDNVDSFSWDNPVESLYLPLGGMESCTWWDMKGKLINAGSECVYWTNDVYPGQSNTHVYGAWFKVAGDVNFNKGISLTFAYAGFGGLIRCIKDF